MIAAVINVSPKEYKRVEENLLWCVEMGMPKHQACVIHSEPIINTAKLQQIAAECFDTVYSSSYPEYKGDFRWPRVQNYAFQEAAIWMLESGLNLPWFWWEPDGIPLVPDWLGQIEDEYYGAGKPWMGRFMYGITFTKWIHVNGNLVAPPDAPVSCPRVITCGLEQAWDWAAGPDMVPIAHDTKLISNIWTLTKAGLPSQMEGDTPVFKTWEDYLKVHEEGVVYHHRDKTGSLIPLLRQQL